MPGDFNWLEQATAPKTPKPSRRPIAVDPAEVDNVVAEMSRNGETAKKLRADVAGALEGVKGLYHSGLTREALVLLVWDRTGFTKKHRVKPTPEVVGLVLDALGRLDEYLVKP